MVVHGGRLLLNGRVLLVQAGGAAGAVRDGLVVVLLHEDPRGAWQQETGRDKGNQQFGILWPTEL